MVELENPISQLIVRPHGHTFTFIACHKTSVTLLVGQNATVTATLSCDSDTLAPNEYITDAIEISTCKCLVGTSLQNYFMVDAESSC